MLQFACLALFSSLAVVGMGVNLYISFRIWKTRYEKSIFDLGKEIRQKIGMDTFLHGMFLLVYETSTNDFFNATPN